MDDLTLCIVGIIGGIICGAISASIMKNKGRSEGGGWALGLLLGIFGLIIAAVLPASEEGVQYNKLQSGLYKQCQYCRKLVDKNAVICPYCRSQL